MSIKEYFFNCCYSILVSWLLRFSIKLVEFCKKIEKHINVLSLLTNNWKTKLSNFRFFSLIAVVFFSINIFSLNKNFSNIGTRINLSSENFPKELKKQQCFPNKLAKMKNILKSQKNSTNMTIGSAQAEFETRFTLYFLQENCYKI